MPDARPEDVPDRRSIRRWAKLRLWAGYIYLLCAVVLARPQMTWTILGVLLILLGIAVRLLAASTLVKDTELCADGIYSATRNPLYLGSALIGLGVAALTGSGWFLAAFLLALTPLYWRMIALEERYLTALHPDAYPSYAGSVPRFFPRLSALSGLAGTLDLARLRRSRELTSAALILLITAILLAWHRSWLPV